MAGLIGTIIAIVTSIISLAYWLGRKFARIEIRLQQLEKEFNMRFQRFEEGFDIRFQRFNARFQQLERRIDSLASFTRSTYTLLIDFMTMKGLFTKEERFLD